MTVAGSVYLVSNLFQQAPFMNSISQIESISVFDRQSIDYLISCLHDPSLELRYHAYHKLNSDGLDIQSLSDQEIETIAMGVLLNPDDVVWSVYLSGRTYDDEEFSICDFSDDSGEEIYGREIYPDLYVLANRGVVRKMISTHVDRESAEAVASMVIKNLLCKDEYPYLSSYSVNQETKISQQDIYNWVKIYDLPDLPQPPNPQPFDWIDGNISNPNRVMNQKYIRELHDYCDRLKRYAVDVVENLTVADHFEVIDRIYSNLFGRLAYVCKETVRATTYFTH